MTKVTIPINMQMEAGQDFSIEYNEEGCKEHNPPCVTIHSGVGWIGPFGRASYVGGINYPIAEKYLPDYMKDPSWNEAHETKLFCIYTLDDDKWKGSRFYAWDGVVGNLKPEKPPGGKSDYLINVIVGGEGIFKDATGFLVGYTYGREKLGREPAKAPEATPEDKPEGGPGAPRMPDSILKLMKGYVNLQTEGEVEALLAEINAV
jgi:hypothetical protein